MLANIAFDKAAFKHGVTEADIRHALRRPVHEQLWEAYTNKWIVIGYDIAGNLLEVAYNSSDEETVNVFHAMPCRKKFINQLNQWGELWQG